MVSLTLGVRCRQLHGKRGRWIFNLTEYQEYFTYCLIKLNYVIPCKKQRLVPKNTMGNSDPMIYAERPRKVAQRIIGSELPSVDSIYLDRILTKVTRIMRDSTHPLFSDYNYNRSGIRLCVPRTRRARFRSSFVPDSIHVFNSRVTRGQSTSWGFCCIQWNLVMARSLGPWKLPCLVRFPLKSGLKKIYI